jgi:hypothetical protein
LERRAKVSRSFFTTDEEYIDFLECRCRSLARTTKSVKGMLKDRNKQVAILSEKITKEHEKRVKAQIHIERLKKEKKKDKMIAIHTFGDKPVTFEVETDGEKLRELFNV